MGPEVRIFLLQEVADRLCELCTFDVQSPFFVFFFKFFWKMWKKKFTVTGFKAGSVGLQLTHLSFFVLQNMRVV